MAQQEASLIEKLTSSTRHIIDPDKQSHEGRLLQLQFQMNSMASQMSHDQTQFASLITALRTTPNMPEEAIKLLPGPTPRESVRTQIGPTPLGSNRAHTTRSPSPLRSSSSPATPTGARAAIVEEVHSDSENLLNQHADDYQIAGLTADGLHDGFEDFGPSSVSKSRPSPYGDGPQPEAPQPFSQLVNPTPTSG